MCAAGSTTGSEVKAQLRIGVPVAFSAVLRRSMAVWTVGFVGRLGPTAMAAAALANSTTNTFALSIMVGLSSASVTLVSQAVGAKDARQAGLWLHRALLVHALTAVPLTVFLLCFAPLLVAIGQDANLAAAAGSYAAMLIPGMWAWAAMWALQPWLQAHGVVRVQTATSAAAALLHPGLLFLLVPRGGLAAAATTDSVSNCVSVLLLALSVGLVPRLRAQLPLVRPCRSSVARLPTFLRLGIPGVVNMFEWWASELNILVSGLLPRPALALSALSVYQAHMHHAMCTYIMPCAHASCHVHMPHATCTCLMPCAHASCHVHMPHAMCTCIMPRAHTSCHVHMHHAMCTCIMPCAHASCHVHMHHATCTCLMPRAHAPCHVHMPHAMCTCLVPCAHASCHVHMPRAMCTCLVPHLPRAHASCHTCHVHLLCTCCAYVHVHVPCPVSITAHAPSVHQTVNAVCFMLPLGASVAGATRVGQALGRGDAAAARRAAAAAVVLGICAALGAASLLLLLRNVLPAVFTPDEEVQALVRSLLPLLALYVVADASQAR